ncbi:MAG TPA: hypothetical protein VIS96_07520 [Terrimicrobiaceae bacterium]
MHEGVREAERTGNLIGVRLSACDEEESDPWLMPPSQKKKPEVIAGPLPDRVAVTLGNLVYVPKDGLPSAMLNQLLRLAAFQKQYVGRLHRLHADKKEVIVYDYTDDAVPMLAAMFGRRLKGYEAAGDSVEDELPLSSV